MREVIKEHNLELGDEYYQKLTRCTVTEEELKKAFINTLNGNHLLSTWVSWKRLCPPCRGPRRLCGKPVCPITMQYYAFMRLEKFQDLDSVHGNSPLNVFVGRYGYHKVRVGPILPPVVGDTSIYDYPEMWLEKSLDDILGFRSSLIHGKLRVDENPKEEKTRQRNEQVTPQSII